MVTKTISKNAKKIITQYFSLQIGDKKISTPYYINESYTEAFKKTHQYPPDIIRFHRRRKIERVYVAKGTPRELEMAVENLAKSHSFNLQKASTDDIREFMLRHELGIDCSGFVVWIINEIYKENYKKPIWKFLQFKGNVFRKLLIVLRPVENISVTVLADSAVEVLIKDIKPADIITSWNGNHVLLVTTVTYNDNNLPVSFDYVNATWWYGKENGVRKGKVNIDKQKGNLSEQAWINDTDEKGINWTYKGIKAGSKLLRLPKL